MPGFQANDLQRALFVEVLNASMYGSGNDLADRPEVVHAWLLQARPTLTELAGLGRAAVRNGRSDCDTMLLDFMRAMSSVSSEVLRWLNNWDCLRSVVSPDALNGLDTEACLAKFRTLATLDAGL